MNVDQLFYRSRICYLIQRCESFLNIKMIKEILFNPQINLSWSDAYDKQRAYGFK